MVCGPSKIENSSVGWLGVNENKGFLDANLLWQGGSVEPISNVFFMMITHLW